jgi:thioredoxin
MRLLMLVAFAAALWLIYRSFRRPKPPPDPAMLESLPDPATRDAQAGETGKRKAVGTAANFDELVARGSGDALVLVDFWAPWCGPCRTLSPILDGVLERYAGKVRLVTINVDEQPELSARFGISGIPAVKLFRDGVVADEFVGVRSERQIQWMLDQQLPPKEPGDAQA